MLNRKDRIKFRSEQYANGYISLEEFFRLEQLDETLDFEEETVKVTPKKAVVKPAKPAKPNNKLNMTKAEWNKLSLVDQHKIYEEFPQQVKALLDSEE